MRGVRPVPPIEYGHLVVEGWRRYGIYKVKPQRLLPADLLVDHPELKFALLTEVEARGDAICFVILFVGS